MLNLRVIRSLTVAALLVSATAFCESAPQAAGPSEAALLAVLRSGASMEEKGNACRQLARVGTRDAVPVLAGLLSDEKLAHRARQTLECIPDPAVEDALREAAPKLQGRLLMGVVCSLGVRRDAKSVDLLVRLLKDADAEVVSAAAVALGKIGTPAAAKALASGDTFNSEHVPGAAVKAAFWDAGLRCAEALAAAGQRDEALAIYDRMRELPGTRATANMSPAPFQVRVAATRGAIVTRQAGGIALLTELLAGADGAMFNLALQLVLEMPGPEATRAIAAQIAKLPTPRQALLVQAMGNRGDKAALPEIHTAAKDNDAAVRIAAIRALVRLGDASSLPVLFEACGSPDKNVAEAAVATIVRLPGGDVDAALIAMAGKSDDAKNLTVIDCLGRRTASSAAPALLKIAGVGEPQARLAALQALASAATAADLPALVAVLLKAGSAAERDAAERALIDTCAGAREPSACAGKLVEALSLAQPEAKVALLRVLNVAGGSQALQAMRSAIKDANAEVQDAAVRALCNWPTSDAAPDLLELAKTSAKDNIKVLALRGYIRLANDAGLAADKRLAMCGEAAPLVQSDDGKRQLLGALGAIPSAKALALIVPHIENPAVCGEACNAAVAVAGKLMQSAPDAKLAAAGVAEAMEKVKQNTKNKKLLEAAGRLLTEAQKLK